MKVVFFGTSSFAAKVLEHLLNTKINIIAIVTRPDRPSGRGLVLSPSPVKQIALKTNIPLLQPPKASTEEFANTLKGLDADLFLVVAYGEIIKDYLLKIPKKDCINVHASLLPKYRGASPIRSTLLNGEEETGITIISMNPKMDEGDMVYKKAFKIPQEMDFGELNGKLTDLACESVVAVIKDFKNDDVKRIPQNHSLATYTNKISTKDAEIKWDMPASKIHNLIRAFAPSPGAWCFIQIDNQRKRFKITKAKILVESHGELGNISIIDKQKIIVSCKENSLELLEVQLEGKKRMPVDQFLRGISHPIKFI